MKLVGVGVQYHPVNGGLGEPDEVRDWLRSGNLRILDRAHRELMNSPLYLLPNGYGDQLRQLPIPIEYVDLGGWTAPRGTIVVFAWGDPASLGMGSHSGEWPPLPESVR